MRLKDVTLIGLCSEAAAKRTALLFDGVTIVADWERGLEIDAELSILKPNFVSVFAIQDNGSAYENTDKVFMSALARMSSGNGVECVPILSKMTAFNTEFDAKEHQIYNVLLDNIPIADEASLSWQQVIEVRQNPELLKRFVDLRMWLRTIGDTKSANEVRDTLEDRLLKYQAALSINGIKTINGALTVFLDPAKLVTSASVVASTAIVTNTAIATLAAGLLVAGNVAVKLTENFIAKKQIRTDFAEIALLEDLGKLAGNS
jgi:hypothetical protein